jgi:hypothetical protein
MKFSCLLILGVALAVTNAWAGREGEGPGAPTYDLICESQAKDVSVRIMRIWPHYDKPEIVIIPEPTMLLFSEPVKIVEPKVPGAARVYHSHSTDLSVQISVSPITVDNKLYVPAVLETRPYSGRVKLLCEVTH